VSQASPHSRKSDGPRPSQVDDFPWLGPGESSPIEFPGRMQMPPMRGASLLARLNPITRWMRRRDWQWISQLDQAAWMTCCPSESGFFRFLSGDKEKSPTLELGDIEQFEGFLGGALQHFESEPPAGWNDAIASVSRYYALVAAKRLGDPSIPQFSQGEGTTKGASASTASPEEMERRLGTIFRRMEFAMQHRGAAYGVVYGKDFVQVLDFLCGRSAAEVPPPHSPRLLGAPIAPNARFSGRRLEFCEATLARIRAAHGADSHYFRWMLAWCTEALREAAAQDASLADKRRHWMEELLEIERTAPQKKGMVHFGSAILLAANDAQQQGDIGRAEQILRDGVMHMAGRVDGLPTRFQQVRGKLLRVLLKRGAVEEAEALLRDMIALEEREHDPEGADVRSFMGPSIGWLRNRLARMLERQGRLEEAESCYRAGVGDAFGIRSSLEGIRILAHFLLRHRREKDAFEAVDEVFRRTRASTEPDARVLCELLVLEFDALHPLVERGDPAWRRRADERLDEAIALARRLDLDPPMYVGEDQLHRIARAAALHGRAEQAVELLRPLVRAILAMQESERRDHVETIFIYAYCLRRLDESSSTSDGHPQHPSSPEDGLPDRRWTDLRRERRQHLSWVLSVLMSEIDCKARGARSKAMLAPVQLGLANLLVQSGEYEEARALLEDALARAEGAGPPLSRWTWSIGRALIDVLEKLHRFDEVAALAERFPESAPPDDEAGAWGSDLDADEEGDGEPGRI
jgi:tetratricopeptide (TPR) repeat protein